MKSNMLGSELWHGGMKAACGCSHVMAMTYNAFPQDRRRGRLETVALAKLFEAEGLSYRKISAKLAELGHVTRTGKPHVASAAQKLLEE
jgi:hypothetical protein